MDSAFISDVAARLGRTLLQVLGTYFTTHGVMASSAWEAISGALVVLASTAYSIYSAKKASSATVATVSAAVQKATGV